MEEVVGDVEVKLQQRYKGYSNLLDKFLKDPAYGILGTITPYAGGLSFNEKRCDALNSDLRNNPFSVGSASNRSTRGYDAPYFKNIDILTDTIDTES